MVGMVGAYGPAQSKSPIPARACEKNPYLMPKRTGCRTFAVSYKLKGLQVIDDNDATLMTIVTTRLTNRDRSPTYACTMTTTIRY